jgi:hypothetical protein
MNETFYNKRLGVLEEELINDLSSYCQTVGVDNAMKRTETVFNRDDCRLILPVANGKPYDNIALIRCAPILKELQKYDDLKGLVPYRIELSFVKPNSAVYPHSDRIYFHSLCRRTHVVLKSEGSYYANINEDGTAVECEMKQNEVWIINNRKIHTAKNTHNSVRIHMIIDFTTPSSHEMLVNDRALANKSYTLKEELSL